MGRCGGQMLTLGGRLIAMGAGSMNLIGDGPGFRMTTGAGLRITTAVGCMSMAGGDGGRDRRMVIRSTVRSGRRLMFHSLDGAAASDLELASAMVSEDGDRLGGSRLDRVTIFTPGMDDMAVASEPADLANITGADLLRCTAERDFQTSISRCMTRTSAVERLCQAESLARDT